ncbi:MAG: protein kinase [Thermoanaerobaculia bacterium]|nr:protein kinase [Thermoanaerobaculia bacterium]
MIGKTLGHYEITGRIGAGGMGEVYRARDTLLEREVAVKVLPPGVADDTDRRARFEREAKALAALSHPNTVSIFDFGVEDGVAYAVMELLRGRTLADEIGAGPLGVERTLELGVRMARGLVAAHEKGILHRDLKPQNVFLTRDDRLKILDFGLAKRLVEPEAGESAATLAAETAAGTVLGTVAYLSPERIRAASADVRADLFALGVILYEMVTGRNPFVRDTAPETIGAILSVEPADPEGAPPALLSLLRDCLEKDPRRRIASAREVVARLEACRTAPASDSIDSLAVLPLHNEADDENADYLIDGLTDSLIDTLSRLPQLKVMARSTVFRCRDLHDRPEEVGRELGVRAVLTGRLQMRAGTLVIRAELVDATDGTRLWGARLRRPVGDALVIEDEICREIADNLRFQLSPEEKDRIAPRRTRNPEAHEAYLKGRHVWNRWKTPEAMYTAIGFFERALALDPLYAQAFAGLADSYSILGNVKAISPGEAYPKAKNAALQGLAIDDGLAELHTSLGFVQRFWEWDWEASRRSYERAIELNPGYATAHRFYANLLTGLGEHEAAFEQASYALELDPLSLILLTVVGDTLFYARRYDEAIGYYRRCVEMDEGFLPGHTDLARALELAGRYDEAVAEFRKAEALAPKGPPEPSSGLAHVYAQMGRREEALAIVEELKALSTRRYVSPYGIASIYACLGEVETALDWLERAHREHDQTLVWLKVHPRLDPVRGEPRYERLLEKMNLL